MPTGIEKLFGGRLPERRQEGIDLTGRSGGESRQNIFKPVAEADVVGFARCRERVEDSQTLPAGFTSGERKHPVRYMSGAFPTNADWELKNYFETGFQNGGRRESI